MGKEQLFNVGKFLKTLGIEIKSFKKAFQSKDGIDGLITLKDGRKGIYSTLKSGNTLTQEFNIGGKSIRFNTVSTESAVDVSRAGKWINVPETKTIGVARDAKGQITDLINFKRTPVGSTCYKAENGNYRTRVRSVQELHTDKRVGPVRLPQDVLIGADGKMYPIYQRPMASWDVAKYSALKY